MDEQLIKTRRELKALLKPESRQYVDIDEFSRRLKDIFYQFKKLGKNPINEYNQFTIANFIHWGPLEYVKVLLDQIPPANVRDFFYKLQSSSSIIFFHELIEQPVRLKVLLDHGLDPNTHILGSFANLENAADNVLFWHRSNLITYPIIFYSLLSSLQVPVESVQMLVNHPDFNIMEMDGNGSTVFNIIERSKLVVPAPTPAEDQEWRTDIYGLYGYVDKYARKVQILVNKLAERIKWDMTRKMHELRVGFPGEKIQKEIPENIVLYTYYSDICIDIYKHKIPKYYILAVAKLFGIPWLDVIQHDNDWFEQLCNLIRDRRLSLLNKGRTVSEAIEPLQKRTKKIN